MEMDYQEVGLGLDWVDLAQDRVTWRAILNAAMTRRFP